MPLPRKIYESRDDVYWRGWFVVGGVGGSGRLGVGGGEVAVVDGEGGGHELLAVGGDPVEALVFDLGHQAVTAQLGDEP